MTRRLRVVDDGTLKDDDSNLADVTLGELDFRGYGDLSSEDDDAV